MSKWENTFLLLFLLLIILSYNYDRNALIEHYEDKIVLCNEERPPLYDDNIRWENVTLELNYTLKPNW